MDLRIANERRRMILPFSGATLVQALTWDTQAWCSTVLSRLLSLGTVSETEYVCGYLSLCMRRQNRWLQSPISPSRFSFKPGSDGRVINFVHAFDGSVSPARERDQNVSWPDDNDNVTVSPRIPETVHTMNGSIIIVLTFISRYLVNFPVSEYKWRANRFHSNPHFNWINLKTISKYQCFQLSFIHGRLISPIDNSIFGLFGIIHMFKSFIEFAKI